MYLHDTHRTSPESGATSPFMPDAVARSHCQVRPMNEGVVFANGNRVYA